MYPNKTTRFAANAAAVIALVVGASFALTGCASSQPTLVGIWQGDDGTKPKTINEDGTCTGMYYNAGKPLDIGGRATCSLGEEKDASGRYLLVVRQSPNERTYQVDFVDEKTAVLLDSEGKSIVTLTRQ